MKNSKIALLISGLLFLTFSSHYLYGQYGNLKGQASGWTFFNDESLDETQIGLRYISTYSNNLDLDETKFIDTEIAVNAFANGSFQKENAFYDNGKIKPYRMWLRFSASQFEVRAGLQKINFGAAFLLRPLMWFDRIDPRDPLGLTDGVYGILVRQYFVNNANLWFWALYGNDKTRGWDFLPSDKDVPELGGRIQFPVGPGELAFTYHRREANPRAIFVNQENIVDNRFAVDGKWDAVIGFWVEAAASHQDLDFVNFAFSGFPSLNYSKFITLGADYTFGIGNGLHVLAEHLNVGLSDDFWEKGDTNDFTAITTDYSLGIFDQLVGIIYFDWDNSDMFRYFSWRRTYDNWSFYTNIFWNSGQSNVLSFQSNNDFFNVEKGLQLMVVYNH